MIRSTHGVEVAVVDVESLGVWDAQDGSRRSASDELRTVVGGSLGDGVGETARGVVGAVENVDDRVTGLLSRDARPDHRGDVRVVDPWLDNGRTNRVRNHDRVVIVVGNGGNEVVGIAPQGQVLAAEKLTS